MFDWKIRFFALELRGYKVPGRPCHCSRHMHLNAFINIEEKGSTAGSTGYLGGRLNLSGRETIVKLYECY